MSTDDDDRKQQAGQNEALRVWIFSLLDRLDVAPRPTDDEPICPALVTFLESVGQPIRRPGA